VKRTAASRDVATRERLLVVATRLFAERGFGHVSVRDICSAASANVAAVNYHFGDKQRLYLAVIETALDAVRKFADAATSAPPGAGPEERLRHYVRAHLVRGSESGAGRRAAILRELFRHEFTQPTGAAPRLVEQALLPRWRYLAAIVTELLGPATPPEVVADGVLSIQAQCLLPLAAPVALNPALLGLNLDRERLAEHVVKFSLAGLRALGAAPQGRGRGRGARDTQGLAGSKKRQGRAAHSPA
jgi:AcrR family transcriptional regulator